MRCLNCRSEQRFARRGGLCPSCGRDSLVESAIERTALENAIALADGCVPVAKTASPTDPPPPAADPQPFKVGDVVVYRSDAPAYRLGPQRVTGVDPYGFVTVVDALTGEGAVLRHADWFRPMRDDERWTKDEVGWWWQWRKVEETHRSTLWTLGALRARVWYEGGARVWGGNLPMTEAEHGLAEAFLAWRCGHPEDTSHMGAAGEEE
jgi:hypothetical protein